jgi:hypothetical protein
MSTTTIASIIAFVALACSPAFPQESRGTITGRVTDASGAVVVGAEIRAVNRQTASMLSVRTNDAGSYTLPYLAPGTYDLTAEFAGFKKTGHSNVDVRVNDVLSIDFQLEIGAAAETVEVSSGTPLIETNNVSLGLVVAERQIKDLPLQAGNANELVLLPRAWSTPPISASARAVSTAPPRSSQPMGTRCTPTNTRSTVCPIRFSMAEAAR